MEKNDPKQVIIEFLSSPPGELVEPGTPAAEEGVPPVPQAELRKPGGFSAKVESIQFRKERSIPQRQVYAVTFEDEKGMQWHLICSMMQNADGQWFLASAGGGGGGSSDKDSWRGPQRSHAWANLAGGGWEDHFWAGGYVSDNGTPVAKVRLTSSNGQVLEDTVQDDLVLFVTDQKIQVPMEAKLYGLSGELIGEHSLFEHHGSHSQALHHPEAPDEEKS